MLSTKHIGACTCTLLLAFTSTAFAGEGTQLIKKAVGKKARISRIAPAVKNADGTIEVGHWTTYSPTEATCLDASLIFDNFTPDSAGLPTGADACGEPDPGTRYLQSVTPGEADYCVTRHVNDFTVVADAAGTLIPRYELAWWWEAGGAGTSEEAIIGLFIYEDNETSCTLPFPTGLGGGSIAGVLIGVTESDGSPLQSSATDDAGYFIDVCLDDLGADQMLMPLDGNGAYEVSFLTEDAGGAFVPATCAQSFLWGTDVPGFPTEGSSTAIQWDDDTDITPFTSLCAPPDCTDLDADLICDNVPDNVLLSTCECYDYTGFATCPDPVGAMIAMYGDTNLVSNPQISCPVPGLAGASNTFTVTDVTPGATIAWVLGTAGGSTPMPSPCLGDTVDLSGASLVFTAVADPAGVATFSVTIPSSFAGSSVDLQAVEIDAAFSCPKSTVVSCAIF